MSVISPIDLRFDLTNAISLEGKHTIAGWLFLPPAPKLHDKIPLLFCLPGGTYSKGYYHLEVPGYPGYSFAQHMAELGFAVAAIDHLGVGESSAPEDPLTITHEIAAAANAVVARELRRQMASGTLHKSLPPIRHPEVVGIGHSMGGLLATVQQARWNSFDAVAILGWGNLSFGLSAEVPFVPPDGSAPMSQILRRVSEIAREQFHGHAKPPRKAMRRAFYLEDVPAAVIEADEAASSTLPGILGVLGTVEGIVKAEAARITSPVFIGWSEREAFGDPYREVSVYSASKDITLFILEGAAHCHNFATTRTKLWNRLAAWVPAALPGSRVPEK
ncbi:MAG: alpha/beta hydrolase [Candidatus Binataceae bacterium]